MKKLVLLIPIILTLACQPPPRETVLSVDENGNIQGTLPDGTVVNGEEEYGAAIAAETGTIEEMQPLALTVKPVTINDGGAKGLAFGKFRIYVQPSNEYVESCVRKKFLHLKIVVDTDEIPGAMVELHLMAWFDSNKPCFAVTNTGFIGYGWCYKVCVENPKTSLKNGIKGGLVAAGVSAAAAGIMAAVLTPIAATALAL